MCTKHKFSLKSGEVGIWAKFNVIKKRFRLQDLIKQHVLNWLIQQVTRPRRSQPHISSKQNDTKPESDPAIGQHLLENEQ